MKMPNLAQFNPMLYIKHLQYRIISSSTREFEFPLFETFPNLETCYKIQMIAILPLKSPISNRTETPNVISQNWDFLQQMEYLNIFQSWSFRKS